MIGRVFFSSVKLKWKRIYVIVLVLKKYTSSIVVILYKYLLRLFKIKKKLNIVLKRDKNRLTMPLRDLCCVVQFR